MVDIANQNEVSIFWEGLEEMVEEGEIEHRGFVDHNDIADQGTIFVAGEPPSRWLVVEKTVDGFGFSSTGFGEAFGGPSGGGAK